MFIRLVHQIVVVFFLFFFLCVIGHGLIPIFKQQKKTGILSANYEATKRVTFNL